MDIKNMMILKFLAATGFCIAIVSCGSSTHLNEDGKVAASGVAPKMSAVGMASSHRVGRQVIPASGIVVQYSIVNNWESGFQTELKINNNLMTDLNNWKLTFNFSPAITSIWDASREALSQGTAVEIDAPTWSTDLKPNDSATLGFIASGDSSMLPSGCKLNGLPCTFSFVGSPTSSPSPTPSSNPSLTPSPSPTIVSPTPVPVGLQIQYSIGSSWDGGFSGNFTITNAGPAIQNWNLSFVLPSNINNIWNAIIANASGNEYKIVGASYDVNLTTGATVTVGFTAQGDSTQLPSSCELNGITCTFVTSSVTSAAPTPVTPSTPTPTPSPTVIPTPTSMPTSLPIPGPLPSGIVSTAGFCNNKNISVSPPSYGSAPSSLDRYGKIFVGYFSSWFDPGVQAGQAANTQLANIASYVNVVNFAFMRPDATYTSGSYLTSPSTFNQATGITYASSPTVLKEAIQLLHNKGTKVLISVGGATYPNFGALNVNAIRAVVEDMGFDGVDIDFEEDPSCSWSYGGQSCTSDSDYEHTIESIRSALPRPYLITLAAWSIGAYGQGPFVCDTPMANRTGMAINPLLKDGDLIDMINVMSYDAGVWKMGMPQPSDQQTNPYYPIRAVQAYQQLFPGYVVGGIEVPSEAWGGNSVTPQEISTYGAFVLNSTASGLMLWSLQGSGNGTTSFTPQAVATDICIALGGSNCSIPLLGGH